MLEALRENPERKGLRLGHGFFGTGSVGEHAGQLGNFGQPPTVVFLFALEFQIDRNLPETQSEL